MTLREFRRARNLSMEAIGMLGGVDTSTISRIETGKQKASPETVVRLAMALGLSARRMKAICDAALPTEDDAA